MMTREQVGPALDAILAVGEAIREAGEVPAGTLYAVLCGRMDIGSFNGLVNVLCGAGLVERKASGLLRWVGPNIGHVDVPVKELEGIAKGVRS